MPDQTNETDVSTRLTKFVSLALGQNELSGLAEMLRFIAESYSSYACVLWRIAPGVDWKTEPGEARLFVLAQWLGDQRFWTGQSLDFDSDTGRAIMSGAPAIIHRPNGLRDPHPDVTSFCSVPIRFLDGQAGAVNVYRTDGVDFNPTQMLQVQQLALLLPPLYQTILDKVAADLASQVNQILHDAERHEAASEDMWIEMKDVVQKICGAVGKRLHAAEVSVFFGDSSVPNEPFRKIGTTWQNEFPKTEYQANEPALTGWILGRRESVNVFDLMDFRDTREKERIQRRYSGLEWSDSLDFQDAVQGFFPHAGDHPRPLSFIGAPVLAGDTVLGAIRCCAALKPPYYFTDRELRLLELVSGQLGRYWINWLSRRNADSENRAWREIVRRISVLNRSVQNAVIAGNLNDQTVFEEALEIAEAVIPGAETLDIRLLDQDAGELRYGPTRGARWGSGTVAERKDRLARRYRIDGDSIGAVVVRTQTSRVMDAREEVYHGPFGDTISMIVVPLMSRDHVVGVMDIRTSQLCKFPTYAVSIAELLGQQLGLYQDLSAAMSSQKKAQAELEALLRGQTQTYEDLGHQLKSPVFQAEARIQNVLRTFRLDDDLRLQLSAVRGLIVKTKRVSMSIRLYAQLADQKQVPLQMAPLSPDDLRRTLIEYGLDHTRLLDPGRQIRFQVEQEGFDVLRMREVNVDYDLLEQSVNNLLDNAFKYSFPRTTIRIRVGVVDGHFHITVMNEGIPLRSGDVEHAKQRGWRSEEAESATGEGSGIGLWIVDRIMKTLGGQLIIYPTNRDNLTLVQLLFPINK